MSGMNEASNGISLSGRAADHNVRGRLPRLLHDTRVRRDPHNRSAGLLVWDEHAQFLRARKFEAMG